MSKAYVGQEVASCPTAFPIGPRPSMGKPKVAPDGVGVSFASASGGGQNATFGYDSNGNMTSVSGALFGSKTLTYNDDNRLTRIVYNGSTTDDFVYTYTGLRYKAVFAGTTRFYLHNGERVLEELDNTGTMTARYTTENGSYYGQWLHLYRPSGTLSRFPMYDNIGTARGLVDASGTVTDWYELDTFGRQVSSSGTTPNPYRYGAAWGYITDPSGLLQLGARHYWPELGRFVSQDPIGAGDNWYAYVENGPLRDVDPVGTEGSRRHCNNLYSQFKAALANGDCKTANKKLGDMRWQCSKTPTFGGERGKIHASEEDYIAKCKPEPCPRVDRTPCVPFLLHDDWDPARQVKACMPEPKVHK